VMQLSTKGILKLISKLKTFCNSRPIRQLPNACASLQYYARAPIAPSYTHNSIIEFSILDWLNTYKDRFLKLCPKLCLNKVRMNDLR
jgi:hypothetical protein